MLNDISPELRAQWQVPEFETSIWRGRQHAWCVVIPVLNEGDRIGRLLARMTAIGVSSSADIIVIDGGSDDGSLEATTLEAHDVAALLVKTGGGQLSAQLRSAYAFALDEGYDGVVTIDGNDKDDPAAIPQFIAALRDGQDFVQASRYVPGGVQENTPKHRDLAIRLIHAPLLRYCSGFAWTDTTQGFRAYSRRMLLNPAIDVFRDVFMSYELLAYLSYRAPRLGYRCVELPTVRKYPTGEIPTKISGLRGKLRLLLILLRACKGSYDPKNT